MNRALIILLLTGIILQSCEPATNTKSKPDKSNPSPAVPWKLICLGDGITAGVGVAPEYAYPTVLETQLAAEGYKVKIVNAGIKGETVQGANERVEWILQQRFSAILFALGCEDQKQNRDPKVIQEQWGFLLTKVRRAYPEIPVFVMSPCAEDGIFTQSNFYANLSSHFEITFLPLHLKSSSDWWAANFENLTLAGQAELARQLQKVIEPAIQVGD